MKTKTNLFVLLLAMLMPAMLRAQESLFSAGSFEEIQAKARAEKKLVFVDLMFEGCMPCKQMEVQVFPDKEVRPYMQEHFVMYQGDIFKDVPAKLLARKFAVTGAPHYLIFNGEGKLVDAGSGFMSKKHFLPWLQRSVTDAKAGKVKKYRPGTDGNYPEFYSNFFLVKFRQVAIDTVQTYLDGQQDWTSEENFAVLSLNLNRLPAKYKDYFFAHMHQFARDYGQKTAGLTAYRMLEGKAGEFGKAGDEKSFDKLMTDIRPLYSDKDWKTFGKIIGTSYFKTANDQKGYIRFAERFEGYSTAAKATLAAELAPQVKDKTLLQQMDKWLTAESIAQSETYQADGLLYVKALLRYYLEDKTSAAEYLAKMSKKSFYAEQAAELDKALAGQADFKPKKINIPDPILAD
ncbi:thioredoxin family protein [Chitinophaga lutea]